MSSGRARRIAGLATAAAGLVAVAVGVKFGLDARKAEQDVEDQWSSVRFEEGQTANRNMRIFAGAGTAAVLGGGVLYFLGPISGRTILFDGRSATTWE